MVRKKPHTHSHRVGGGSVTCEGFMNRKQNESDEKMEEGETAAMCVVLRQL